MPHLDDTKNGRELGRKDTALHIWTACPDCGKERWVMAKGGKPISLRCKPCHLKLATKRLIELTKGKHGSGYKGGRTGEGYKLIYLHPDSFFYSMANSNHYVAEHRLIIAQSLGRNLHPFEIIHHKNHVRDDNRLENLQLVSDDKHKAITIMENKIKFLESKVSALEDEIVLLKVGD